MSGVERLLGRHKFDVDEDPTVRRQSALAMLAKFAQETTGTRQLFVEAAMLAARTLESDHFVAIHLQSESSIGAVLSGPWPTSLSVVDVFETTFDRSDSQCLLARAVDALEPLIIDDLAAEQQSIDALLTDLNVRSALFCPVRYASDQYGAIGVLSTVRKPAGQEDILFLESLSLQLGPTIACTRTETILAQQTAMLDATIDSLDNMVLILSHDGKIVRLNQACEEVTGFTPKELIHRHFWGAYLIPADVATAQSVFGQLRLGESPVKCELFLLTKSGERRRFAWTFSQLPDAAGGAAPYMASGIDTTEQYAAQERLKQSEVLIANMREEVESYAGQEQAEQPPIPKNRRLTIRTEFPYFQLIGPIHNGQLPHADEYREVLCRDISPTGFAFIAQVPPDFQEMVVALGAYPSQLYLTAKIIHVNRHDEQDEQGEDLLLVGCEFTSRIHL